MTAILHEAKHLGDGIWYVSDLPGHNGTVRIKGSNSDWGYDQDGSKGIPISEYWQRRLIKYARLTNRDIRLLA